MPRYAHPGAKPQLDADAGEFSDEEPSSEYAAPPMVIPDATPEAIAYSNPAIEEAGSGTSGGGTLLNLIVQGGTTTLDCQSATWTERQATVTIGANGLFTLSASWNPRFATLLIEDIGAA